MDELGRFLLYFELSNMFIDLVCFYSLYLGFRYFLGMFYKPPYDMTLYAYKDPPDEIRD